MTVILTGTLPPATITPSTLRPSSILTIAATAAEEAEARAETGSGRWWERRAQIRRLVGGCPDHWWNPTARRTAACTCDRF